MDDLETVVVAEPDPASVRGVTALVDEVTASLGRPALSEHKRMELGHLSRVVEGSTRSGAAALAVVARRAGRTGPVGYAHVSTDRATRQYAVELVVADAPTSGAGVADALLDGVDRAVAERGGGRVRLWVSEASDQDDDRARRHGYRTERDLLQLRCRLPLPGSGRGVAVETRPFRPGADEEAWVVTNNRAFANHPEQGHWTVDTLVEREREPWFDPDGFLLLEYDSRLAGSCWTKVHDRTDPPMGEIYVIGVDPDFHGRGWGRALTQAGLDWLAARGLTVGMLYVDAANKAAVTMYRSMGFTEHHVDRAYAKLVGAG